MIAATITPGGVKPYIDLLYVPRPVIPVCAYATDEQRYLIVMPVVDGHFPADSGQLKDLTLVQLEDSSFYTALTPAGGKTPAQNDAVLVKLTGFPEGTSITPWNRSSFRAVDRFLPLPWEDHFPYLLSWSVLFLLERGGRVAVQLPQEVMGLKGCNHEVVFDGHQVAMQPFQSAQKMVWCWAEVPG